MEIFAASNGKGVVDGVRGQVKSLVKQKVMSKDDDRIIVKSSKDLADAPCYATIRQDKSFPYFNGRNSCKIA